MSGFYYYLPGVQTHEVNDAGSLNAELMAEIGLDGSLADVKAVPNEVVVSSVESKGPDGGAGVCIFPKPAIGEPPDLMTYDAGAQLWHHVDDRIWIGTLKDKPPTPIDLSRKEQFAGYTVIDSGKREWSVPIARSPDGKQTLPTDFYYERGKVHSRVQERFDSLWQLAERVWDFWNPEEGEPEVDGMPEWLVDAALETLAVNYRVGPAEINALFYLKIGVLDSTSIKNITLALIDFEIAARAAKKKTDSTSIADGSASSAGTTDEQPATDPATAS